MKRFIASLLTLAFVLVLSVPVSAAHYWKLDTSEPTTTSQGRTFNLEYVTLSTEATDDITVQLFQNGVLVGTQTTTKDYGDSGAFTITVPTDGTYTYSMTATSSVDASSVNSETRTVEVKGREIRVVNTGTATGSGGTAGGVQSASSGLSGDTNGDGVVDGLDEAGQVGDDAAATEGEEADVLGEEDRNESDNNWVGAILAALAILAVAYYWFFYRAGRVNPFSRGDNK